MSAKKLPKPKLDKLAWLLPLLPPIISRDSVGTFLGGAVAPQTIKLADIKNTGPRFRIMVNGKIVYRTEYLLEWLEKKGVTQFDDGLRAA